MPIDPTALHEVDYHLRLYGMGVKNEGRPPLTDSALWQLIQHVHGITSDIDPGLLPRLRAAFDAGYQPQIVSITAVATALRAQALYAEKFRAGEHTMLGTGQWPHDGTDTDPWPVAIGPGWHDVNVFAHTDTLTVRRLDPAHEEQVAAGTTAREIADIMGELVRQAPDRWTATVMPTVQTAVSPRDVLIPGQPGLLTMSCASPDSDSFQRHLALLIEERTSDMEPGAGVLAAVFTGNTGDERLTRHDGLIARQHGGFLIFSDGQRVDCESITAVHVSEY